MSFTHISDDLVNRVGAREMDRDIEDRRSTRRRGLRDDPLNSGDKVGCNYSRHQFWLRESEGGTGRTAVATCVYKADSNETGAFCDAVSISSRCTRDMSS